MITTAPGTHLHAESKYRHRLILCFLQAVLLSRHFFQWRRIALLSFLALSFFIR